MFKFNLIFHCLSVTDLLFRLPTKPINLSVIIEILVTTILSSSTHLQSESVSILQLEYKIIALFLNCVCDKKRLDAGKGNTRICL